nr:MAG TPA: hypothetical protein [Microviridae sp.]
MNKRYEEGREPFFSNETGEFRSIEPEKVWEGKTHE